MVTAPAKPLEVCPEGKEYSEGNGIFSVTPVSTAQGRGLAITFFRKIGDCHGDYHGQTAFPGLRNACQHNRNDDPYQTAFSDRSKKTQDLCQPFLMDPLNRMQYL